MAAVSNVAHVPGAKEQIKCLATFAVASTGTLAESAAVDLTGITDLDSSWRLIYCAPVDPSLFVSFVLQRWTIGAAIASLYFRNVTGGTTSIASTSWLIIFEKAPAQF